MARMEASEEIPGTGGRRDDRKKTPEEIAEERIQTARKSKATELDLHNLGLTPFGPDRTCGKRCGWRKLNRCWPASARKLAFGRRSNRRLAVGGF